MLIEEMTKKLKDLKTSYSKKVNDFEKKINTLEESLNNVDEEIDLDVEDKKEEFEITKEAENLDYVFDTKLTEAKYNSDTGEVLAVLIEAGTNPVKKRHYPKATIQESASSFKGLKMYINHPTAEEEKSRPERDLRDWVSTITESWYEDGKAMAKISVHDSWLRERLADPVARENIGLSINAGGKISYGKVNGEEMQIVEQIIVSRKNGPASVDWVTEAGARGRVAKVIKENNQKEDKDMTLKEATFADLQRENPQLVKEIVESTKKDFQQSDEAVKKQKEFDAILKENAELKKEKLSIAQNEKVSAWLKESKSLPEAAKERISKQVNSKIFETEDSLKESFSAIVKEETDYLSKISDKGKIKLSESEVGNKPKLKESIQSTLEKRFGLVEEKKQ